MKGETCQDPDVIIQGHKASDMLLSSDYVTLIEKRKCHPG